jgi:DegV family protein with EDD domain
MVKIVTDSTTDMFDEIISTGVKIVPLYVVLDERMYKERFDLSEHDFYKMLIDGKMFKTSQPSPQDFIQVYKPILENGDEIISIHISSLISGTVNSANTAREILGSDKITVIDSRSASINLGYKVIKALELANKGFSRFEIEKQISDYYYRVFGFFLPTDIDYLNRGGRISHFQKTMSNFLKLYFILHLNEGRIDLYKLSRSKNGSKDELIQIIKDLIKKNGGAERVDVIHGANIEDGEKFRKKTEEELEVPVKSSMIGPVLGSHLGPETVGIGFIKKEA